MSTNGQTKAIATALKTKWDSAVLFAEGGNSWIFKVTSGSQSNAVKVLRRIDSSRYQRFKEEIQTAYLLSDIPNIVIPEDSNTPHFSKLNLKVATSINQIPYFVMPFYERGTAHSNYVGGHPSNDGGINAANLILEVAKIVRDIHDKGHAHRDLKPENILIHNDGRLLVSDFGLCVDLTKIKGDTRQTQQGEIVGSLLYRAPEYLRGRLDDFDHKPGDVFSLGRIFWAFITGKDPIGWTDSEIARTEIKDLVPGIRDGAFLNKIIQNSTVSDRRSRLSIHEFISTIEEWKENTKPSSTDIARIREKINNDPRVLIERQKEERIMRIRIDIGEAAGLAGKYLTESTLAEHLRALKSGDLSVNSGGGLTSGLNYQIPEPELIFSLRFHPKEAIHLFPEIDVGVKIGFKDKTKQMFNYEFVAAIKHQFQDTVYKHFGVYESISCDSKMMADFHKYIRESTDWVQTQVFK